MRRRAHVDDRVEHRAACVHDPERLLLTTWEEARGVLHEDDRHVVDVAEADEARGLVRGGDVDLSRRHGAVVRDEADDVPAHATERGDHVARA